MEDEDISANTNAEIGVAPQLNDEKKNYNGHFSACGIEAVVRMHLRCAHYKHYTQTKNSNACCILVPNNMYCLMQVLSSSSQNLKS